MEQQQTFSPLSCNKLLNASAYLEANIGPNLIVNQSR
jgi:hypothetical protein